MKTVRRYRDATTGEVQEIVTRKTAPRPRKEIPPPAAREPEPSLPVNPNYRNELSEMLKILGQGKEKLGFRTKKTG